MQRYFVNEFNESGFYINKEDLHHIKKVMRMKNGEQVKCIYDQKVYLCEIEEIDSGRMIVVEQLDQDCELPVEVTLIYALPKSDKFEFVLQKACELGVSKVVPLLSKRSIIKTDQKTFSKKYERFNKILKEAAEQSYRNKIPSIEPLISLKQVSQYLGDYTMVAYEQKAKDNELSDFKAYLNKIKKGDRLTIIVGCEGGFEQSEIDELENMGVIPCSLGKRILRSETAPLYMLSAISFAVELK